MMNDGKAGLAARALTLVLALGLTRGAVAQDEPPPPPPPPSDIDQDRVIDSLELPGDSDADGIRDISDPDDDGDGVDTIFELSIGPDDDGNEVVSFRDTDADGSPNHLDIDDDGDGLLTKNEAPDPDGDHDPADALVTALQPDSSERVPDFLNADDDSDGIPTSVERTFSDSDGDGTADYLDDDDDNDGIRRELPGLNTDGDELLDYRDPDDDNDNVPTKIEGDPLVDTDVDGVLDMVDSDDDGDGLLTKDELEHPGMPRDTDGDGTPDYRESDDDGDSLTTVQERTLGDHDDDGLADFLDKDDDGDTIATLIERGFPDDDDRDGVPNWYDLDSDGDGLTDREEGVGDDDRDGLPNFLDPLRGALDAGTIVDAAVDAGAGGGSGAGDAGKDAAAGGVVEPRGDDGDSGCSVSARSSGAGDAIAIGLLALIASLLGRRRSRALGITAALALMGCDSDERESPSFDGSVRLDAGRDAASDAGGDGGDAGISDAQLASECVVEGEPLLAPIEETAERAWTAGLLSDVVHVAYVSPVCVTVGSASGARIDHVGFRSTGPLGAVETVAHDPAGECRLRRSPALAQTSTSELTLFFTANTSGSYELYRQALSVEASASPVSTDAVEALDDELFTVAGQLGDGPLVAYVNRAAKAATAQLVTRRPGGAEREVVALAQNQSPSRLALLTFPDGTGGALGWVTERPGANFVRMTTFDAAGAPNGAATDLSASAGPQSAIALAANDKIRAVLYVAHNGSIGELRFRQLDARGSPAPREVVLSSPDRSISSPSIAVYGGGFVVAFRETPVETGGASSMRLMFLSSAGSLAGERRIADAALSGSNTSQVFVTGDGRIVVLWSDYSAAGAQLRGLRLRCL